MRKKFSSMVKARRFAKGRKVKKGPATKMSNGKKGNWYVITKKAKR